jgi:hypothetical protein
MTQCNHNIRCAARDKRVCVGAWRRTQFCCTKVTLCGSSSTYVDCDSFVMTCFRSVNTFDTLNDIYNIHGVGSRYMWFKFLSFFQKLSERNLFCQLQPVKARVRV